MCLALILGPLLAITICGQAFAAAPNYIMTCLSGNSDNGGVQASDNRVVWASGVDSQIFTWAPGTEPFQVTSNPHPYWVSGVHVSGDRIVWCGDAGSQPQIYTWTPAGGVVQVTSTTDYKENVQVSGDRIVWDEAVGSESDIFTWTPAEGIAQITSSTDNDAYPTVSGDRVVWQASDGNNDNLEIYTWKLGGSVTRITTNTTPDDDPHVSGDRVVWRGYHDGYSDIYTWTPTGGTVALTSSGADTHYFYPKVSGDRVVWENADGTAGQVYTWTPSSGVVQLTNDGNYNEYPQVSGDLVTWDARNGGFENLGAWTPSGGVVQITSGDNYVQYPVVFGSSILANGRYGAQSDQVWKASAAAQIAGKVEGADGTALAGATVTVSLNSSDSHYDSVNAANNLVGSCKSGADGTYSVETAAFRGTGLTTGSILDVTASLTGYQNVTQTGTYSRSQFICDFQAYNTLIGGTWEDRRLPTSGSARNFTQLLPGYLGTPPAVTSIAATSGPTGGGATVTISGTGFNSVSGAAGVTFGGANASSYTVNSDTQITAVTPAHAHGAVQVVVTGAGAAAYYGGASTSYTYVYATISSINPTSGSAGGGTTVTINGKGFANVTGAAGVTFGGTNATSYTVNSDTQITAVAPAHAAGLVNLIVTDPGDSVPTSYTYIAIPTITSISPNSASQAGGSYVHIYGTLFSGLTGLSAVTFDGVNSLNYSINSATDLYVEVPPHAPGVVQVHVAGPTGTSVESSASSFTYTQAPPVITSLSPGCGPLAGGTSVVITGNYFTGLSGAAAVKFGDLNAASYTVDSATQITAVSPAHALGTVSVTVTAAGGASVDTTADDFVYLPKYGTTQEFVADRLTNNSYEDNAVQVSGDRVVWMAASDPTDYENQQVYTWTPSEGTKLLSTTSHDNQRARVYGDRVVWYGYTGSDLGAAEIFTWTPATGLVQITNNSSDDQTPEVYGDRVVWAGWDSKLIYQIYTWTPSGGTKQISSETSNPGYQVVSGDRISWCGDGTRVVKTWTAATGIVDISELEDQSYKRDLHASGDRLVWSSDSGLFTWTPAGGVVQITPEGADGQVSGDRVVWSAWSGLNSQVFTWTPTGGIIQLSGGSDGGLAPAVSGDFVVWVANPASGAVIRGWTPDGGLIEVAASPSVPAVSGDRVAWSAGEFADSEVYTAIVTPIISAAVSGNSPASGPTTGGTSVVITGSGFSALSSASAASTSSATSRSLAATAASAVSFGDEAALSYTIDSDKQITAVAPPHAAGKVDVYVETSTGASATSGSANDYNYVPASLTRIENTDSHIRYTGTWTVSTTPSGVFSGGSCSYSQSTGATVTVSFTGTTLDWIATRDGTGRSATVSVDGGAPMTVSLYSSAPQYQAKAWTTGWLENGAHVVTITQVTGPLNVDAFDTNGSLISFGRVEQTDPRIVKTGSWTDYSATAASGGTYGRSSTSGATATVWFTGTKIAWIGMTGGTPGIVDVYLDGTFETTLDLYSSPAKYQVPLWTSDALPNGLHHLELVRSSSSLSTEYLILDAFDIWGDIQSAPPAITSLSPAGGSAAGGTNVVINGSGFTGLSGASAVTFDGVNAQSYTVNSSTKITATAPAHAAGSVRVQVTTASGTTPDTSADDFTYSVAPPTTRVDIPTTTTGGLTTSGTWAAYTSASAYGASYLRASTAGAYVVLTFQGTRLDWITMKGTTGAKADVYVDGVLKTPTPLDLYASPAVYQQNVWSTGTLPNGLHTVKIVRNSGSVSGRYLTLDAVEVAGALLAPTRIEETSAFFTWNPAWTVGTTTSASGGAYRYTNTKSAYVTFSFTGVGLKLIAKTAPSYGNVTVTIDTVSQTVSLYSSTTTYKKVVLTAFLAPGTHTVTITRLGTKSSSSTGYTVDLDAVDLFGS